MKRLLYRIVALSLGFASPLAFSTDAAQVSDMEQVLKNLVEENQLIGTQFVAIVNEEGLVSFDEFSQEYSDFNTAQSTDFTNTNQQSSPEMGVTYSSEKIYARVIRKIMS